MLKNGKDYWQPQAQTRSLQKQAYILLSHSAVAEDLSIHDFGLTEIHTLDR